jgi:hypothetical protein
MNDDKRREFKERLRHLEESIFSGDLDDAVKLLAMYRIQPPASPKAQRAHDVASARVLRAGRISIAPSCQPFKTIHDYKVEKSPLEVFKDHLADGLLDICKTVGGETRYFTVGAIPTDAVEDKQYEVLRAVASSRTIPAIMLARLKAGDPPLWQNLVGEVFTFVIRRTKTADADEVEGLVKEFLDREKLKEKVPA